MSTPEGINQEEIKEDRINWDRIGMEAIVATCKYSRLIRKAFIMSQVAQNQEERDIAKAVLNLDKQEIIEQYKEIREKVEKLKRAAGAQEEKSAMIRMLEASAYYESAQVIKEKLDSQIYTWVYKKEVMLFETLTISDENLRPDIIKVCIRKYKRKLRKNGCKYAIIFEKGEKTGRPHFHVIYNMNPRLGEKGHGDWTGGKTDVVRVRYLGDGVSNQNEMLLKGYSVERISGYLVKYLSTNKNDDQETDMFKYRTQLSRGFGLWELRAMIQKEKTSKLLKIIESGMKPYQRIFQREIQLELTRRKSPSKEVITRDIVSSTGVTVLSIVKDKRLQDGVIQEARRIRFEGYDKYLAK